MTNNNNKAPMIGLFLVLAVVIAAVLYMITPKGNTPLTIGDQIQSSATDTGVEAGGGTSDAAINIEPDPAKDDGTENPEGRGTPSAQQP